MIPERLLRRRRRGPYEDELELPGVVPFNPNAGIRRPRPIGVPRLDEFAPFIGERSRGTFAGDAAVPHPVAASVPSVRPRTFEPELAPMGGVEIDPVAINAGQAPLVMGGGKIRPRRLPTLPGEEVESEKQYAGALQSFEPQNESKKMTALRIGLGLLSGGIPGALMPLLDRKALDRGFQQRELAGSQQRLEGYRTQRREGVQDELMQEQLRKARLPPAPKLVEQVQPDGTSILVPEAQGVITGRPKLDAVKPRVRVPVPGFGDIEASPEAALGYFGQVNARDEKGRESEFTSEQIQANIREASAERDRIGASLKDVPPQIETTKTDPYTLEQTKVMAPNPAFNDLMERYRSLDDNIRKWRTEMKPGRPRSLSNKTLVPDVEKRIRDAAAAKGLDPEIAVLRAQQRLQN